MKWRRIQWHFGYWTTEEKKNKIKEKKKLVEELVTIEEKAEELIIIVEEEISPDRMMKYIYIYFVNWRAYPRLFQVNRRKFRVLHSRQFEQPRYSCVYHDTTDHDHSEPSWYHF